jgi:stage V sporulation protein D (sporulation-specific penicillin-binding protein)
VRGAQEDFNPRKPKRFVPINAGISLDIAQEIKQKRGLLPGFGVQDGSKRIYPGGEDAAQIVGFMGPLDPKAAARRKQSKQYIPDAVGKAGLESGCEHWLGGTPGYAVAEVDLQHREIPDTLRKLVPARDGLDVFTTLDANAQHIATEEAKRTFEKYHPKGVSVVIVEPKTGNILALVSLPNYDANPGQRHTLKGEALAERTVTHLYEPGSTLKALTVAAALEDGTIQLEDHFYCGGALKVGKKKIHCDFHGAGGRGGHGAVTPLDIIRRSCNVGAAQIALKMTARKLYAAETRFGLFSRPDLSIPAEQRGYLSMDRNENVNAAPKVARVGFGHSITTTPLHVAMAYAAIANGGNLMQPRLLAAVKDSKGNVKEAWEPKVVRRVLSEQTCRDMTAMLRSVVSSGTGKVASVPGYRVAGKTGTAEKYRPGAYVGSFIGFLPAGPNTTPRAVVLVAVDEPQGAYYGGDVAAPVFQAIARRLTDYWNVPKDDPESVQYNEAHKIKPARVRKVAQASRSRENTRRAAGD